VIILNVAEFFRVASRNGGGSVRGPVIDNDDFKIFISLIYGALHSALQKCGSVIRWDYYTDTLAHTDFGSRPSTSSLS
jgi:hypothetical protein